jgi:DNA-directed RNA polymerase specialized sigma24 family protein
VAGGYRAAVSEAREAVGAVWRIESARIVSALARYTGDFALAEDVAQEALAEALVTWPRDGLPRDPAAWLLSVGRRRAIDVFRRRAALDERYAILAHGLGEGGAASGSPPAAPDPMETGDLLWDPERIDDDVLALVFIACHPCCPRRRGWRSPCASSGVSRATRLPAPGSGSRCRHARSVGSAWARCSAWSTSSSPRGRWRRRGTT